MAQRFDRGVFQITVQDNDCRVIVASSDANAQLPLTRTTGPVSEPAAPCQTDIAVEYGASSVLPKPLRKWVNMNYRVRGSRSGNGLVEIYANGRFIARVTGSIGYDRAEGPNQYFKFGIYRDSMPGRSIARLANFQRAGKKPVEFSRNARLAP